MFYLIVSVLIASMPVWVLGDVVCVRSILLDLMLSDAISHASSGLESNPGALPSILRHINETFSKDSSDCLSTLSTILELLRLLTTSYSADDGLTLTRTRTLTRSQLTHILDWAPNRHHPLQDLEVGWWRERGGEEDFWGRVVAGKKGQGSAAHVEGFGGGLTEGVGAEKGTLGGGR